jgi:hypothetical protein
VYGCLRYAPKRAPVGSPPGTPATVKFWNGIDVSMPDFRKPEVAHAFEPSQYLTCSSRGFSLGCAAMDFPTSFPPALTTHTDPTPLPTAGSQAAAIGAPNVVVEGPDSVTIVASAAGVTEAPFSVRNAGTWIGPFRIRVSAPWIVVQHPGDPPGRTLDGGVAIGTDTEVVTQQASPGPPARPRIAQAGYVSELVITANPSLLGASQEPTGTVWIEPLLGGAPFAIEVTLEGRVTGNLPYRQFLPWVSSEPAD